MESVEIEQKFIVSPSFTIPDDWVLATRGKQLNHYFDNGVSTQYKYKEYVNTEDNAKHALTMTHSHDKTVYVLPESNYSDPTSYTLEDAAQDLKVHVDSYLLICGATYQSKWSSTTEGYMIGEGEYFATVEVNSGYGKIVKIQVTLTEELTKDNLWETLRRIEAYGQLLGLSVLTGDKLKSVTELYDRQWRRYYLSDKVMPYNYV